MSKKKRRQSRILSFPRPSSKPLETKPLSDAAKLVWQSFFGPAQAALAQVQSSLANSQELVVREGMMRQDRVRPEDGWRFNADKLRWEKHPKAAESTGA